MAGFAWRSSPTPAPPQHGHHHHHHYQHHHHHHQHLNDQFTWHSNGRVCLEVFHHPRMAIIIITSIITIITSISMTNNFKIKWQSLLGGLPPPQHCHHHHHHHQHLNDQFTWHSNGRVCLEVFPHPRLKSSVSTAVRWPSILSWLS